MALNSKFARFCHKYRHFQAKIGIFLTKGWFSIQDDVLIKSGAILARIRYFIMFKVNKKLSKEQKKKNLPKQKLIFACCIILDNLVLPRPLDPYSFSLPLIV